MATCIYCSKETKLYVRDNPVCKRCSDLMDEGKSPAQATAVENSHHHSGHILWQPPYRRSR